jgi:hypothetical protein
LKVFQYADAARLIAELKPDKLESGLTEFDEVHPREN